MNVFIINLKKRIERRQHIINIFKPYPEFELNIFQAIEDNTGSYGLFKSVQEIIKISKNRNLEYVIICEDDHTFPSSFDLTMLKETIFEASKIGCDILLGGPSSIQDAFFHSNNLLWISEFTGLQFTVIYKRFYDKILSYELPLGSDLDVELRNLSNRIFSTYPMISYQKSFGYSDITAKNHRKEVEQYFIDCQEKMNKLFKVSKFYGIV